MPIPVSVDRLLEEPHGAIDGGDADARIDLSGPAIDLLDIGMILGLRQHFGDGPPLARHAHATLGAETL